MACAGASSSPSPAASPPLLTAALLSSFPGVGSQLVELPLRGAPVSRAPSAMARSPCAPSCFSPSLYFFLVARSSPCVCCRESFHGCARSPLLAAPWISWPPRLLPLSFSASVPSSRPASLCALSLELSQPSSGLFHGRAHLKLGSLVPRAPLVRPSSDCVRPAARVELLCCVREVLCSPRYVELPR
jgi:hypothetical protein